ncbi:MAG: alpha/beta hydrolase [Candidatus Marsarchaeota archaeon]|nr:alpha/beta hydrolase [Candidatus Marsarchaeota archaeon]MCL5413142.1 alpha/beta hydrolase [Candidatus Marsarchaeota archaeon]
MTVPQRKRVFIVHGWDGSPENNWMSWLGLRLQDKGVEAHVLHMPNAADPKMGEWVAFLANAVVNSDANTYLVGHSLGCQTILRYLRIPLSKGSGIGVLDALANPAVFHWNEHEWLGENPLVRETLSVVNS